MGRLDRKVAVVTGSGRGIDRAIALRYAAEGATVAEAFQMIFRDADIEPRPEAGLS